MIVVITVMIVINIIIISWTESSSLMLCMAQRVSNFTLWLKLTEVMKPEQPIIGGALPSLIKK